MRRGQRHPVVIASDLNATQLEPLLESIVTVLAQRLEIARPEALRIVVVGPDVIGNGRRYHPSLLGTGSAQRMGSQLLRSHLLPACRAMQCAHITSMLITQPMRSQPRAALVLTDTDRHVPI
jgi:hypothetical protein